MALIGNDEVIKVLKSYNPWWITEKVPETLAKKIHRAAFFQVTKILDNKDLNRAIVLSGPRRVGKTTLIYQLAARAVANGTSPLNIVYLTLEHPILKLMPIDEILELYERDIAPPTGKRLVLLDELQYVERPTAWLKLIVDSHPSWNIVATGSASIVFRNKDKESGVGRWLTIPVPTLSFFEYLLLRQQEKNIAVPEIKERIPPTEVGSFRTDERIKLLEKLRSVRREFDRYLLQGGFPETALQDDLTLAQRILREDIVDRVLKRDMAAFYGIRKLAEMERLFVYLCIHSGSIINIETISKELKVEKATIYSFLDSFEGAHLVRKLPGYEIGGKKALKGLNKWFIVDASLRNAVLLRGEDIFSSPAELGEVVEASVINHLATYSYPVMPRLGYWRMKKNKEVDLVIDAPSRKKVAVEIKYREQEQVGINDGIAEFIKEYPDSIGVIAVKDSADFEIRNLGTADAPLKVTVIPVFAFLYLLGKFEYDRSR